MWISKVFSHLTLLAVGGMLPTMVAAETTVTVETHDYDPNEYSGKPAKPLFACMVKDPRCTLNDDFTGIPYPGNLQISTCYGSDSVTRFFHRFLTINGGTNTYWMYCNDEDEGCETYVKDNIHDFAKIAKDLEEAARQLTTCNPNFKCYDLLHINASCYPPLEA